jgi:hypothetical protein
MNGIIEYGAKSLLRSLSSGEEEGLFENFVTVFKIPHNWFLS